ncbi:MAG: GntR family transcriptional regulator [Clostridia bacterium]|nr:GntR family transcriptional regulator [Clostridia bacterium]
MAFGFSGKQDVYIEIAEKYEQYILSGIYTSGDKLPSVRTAAGEIGVNPNTVARAYAILEEKGYIRALPKKGAYVIYGEDKPPSGESALGETVDCRAVLAELKSKGLRYEDLILQAKEVFEQDDQHS